LRFQKIRPPPPYLPTYINGVSERIHDHVPPRKPVKLFLYLYSAIEGIRLAAVQQQGQYAVSGAHIHRPLSRPDLGKVGKQHRVCPKAEQVRILYYFQSLQLQVVTAFHLFSHHQKKETCSADPFSIFTLLQITHQPWEIASTGQTSAQEPQSMQVSGSISYFSPASDIASTGHSAEHAPHAMHSSEIL
jgi:hypothetical protein